MFYLLKRALSPEPYSFLNPSKGTWRRLLMRSVRRKRPGKKAVHASCFGGCEVLLGPCELYSPNSLKGVTKRINVGDYIGAYYTAIKGDTSSLGYGSS